MKLDDWLVVEPDRSQDDLEGRLRELAVWDVSGTRAREVLRYLPVGAIPRLEDQRDANQVLPLPVRSASLRATTLIEKLEAAVEAKHLDDCRELRIRAEESLWVAGVASRSIEHVVKLVSAGADEELDLDLLVAAPLMAMAVLRSAQVALEDLDEAG